MSSRYVACAVLLVLAAVAAGAAAEEEATYDGWAHQLHDCRNDWGSDSTGTPEASGHDIVSLDVREGPIPNANGTGFGIRLTLEGGYDGEPAENERLAEVANLSIQREDGTEHVNFLFGTRDNQHFSARGHTLPDEVVDRTNLSGDRFYVEAWFNHHRAHLSDGDTVVANNVTGFHIDENQDVHTRDYAVGGYTDPETGEQAGGCTGVTDAQRYENADGYTIQQTPGPLPEANFTYEPDQPGPGEEVRFTDHSTDPNDAVESWKWYFGDGNESSEQNPTHAYENPGFYRVTLVVTDAEGNTNGTQEIVEVTEPGPRAVFKYVPREPTVNQTVHFNSTGDASDGNHTYRWNLGDGSTASGRNVTHRYDEPGTYEVTLNVTDGEGRSDEASTTITIVSDDGASENQTGDRDGPGGAGGGGGDDDRGDQTDDNQPPTVRVLAPDTGTVGEPVAFGARWSDPDGEVVDRSWDFGDGFTSGEATPNHTFRRPGNYTVTLTVADDGGATATAEHELAVARANGTQASNGTEPGNATGGQNGAPMVSTVVVVAASAVVAVLRRRG